MARKTVHTRFKLPRQRTYLREWRKAKGWTQDVLAEELGISGSQLSRIERAEQAYNQDLLEHAANLLGCSTADLIMRPPGSEGGELQDVLAGLEPEQRAQVIEIAKTFRKAS